jgi:3-dehydroquinate dehydratase/shikimate dehydrogenase
VVKVAYRARSIRDNIELLDLTYEASQGALGGKPMIALGMGPCGLISRVLCPKFGGFLTFASLRRTSASAPGQPTTDELMNLYRFKSIGASTKVYGVIGYPVEHSMSPLIHNAGFDAVEHDGVYLPMPVPSEYEHFKATVLALIDHVNLDFCGCSVTIPHKEHLVRLAREQIDEGDDRWSIDRLSERCGAGNTLVVRRNNRGVAEQLSVMNTDGPAVAGLVRHVTNKRAALIGTGGSTRAIAAALIDEGFDIAIAGRDLERSQKLAGELTETLGLTAQAGRVNACSPDKLHDFGPGVVINCTPVGMRTGPDPKGLAIAREVLRNLDRTCVVLDCVYNPLRTPLLEEAEATGLKAIGGLEMFVAQAAGQFESWTGRTAPSRLFETIVRETLGSRA